MDLNKYQERVSQFARYPEGHAFGYLALGLNGEAGEVAEKIKKGIRDGWREGWRDAVALELGDVLWYLTMLAQEINYPLDEIARLNYEKLASRAERNTLHGSGDNR